MMHERIRQARIDLGLSQVQLALRAGVPRERLRTLENGGNVTMETFEKIVAHLPNLKELPFGGVTVNITGVDVETLRAAIAASEAANRRVLELLEAISAQPVGSPATPSPDPSPSALETRLASLELQIRTIQKGRRDDS
jgi:transcriptional regulator with XRE-family HTH domain